MWFKVLYEGYRETTWELKENLENAKDIRIGSKKKNGLKNKLAKGD